MSALTCTLSLCYQLSLLLMLCFSLFSGWLKLFCSHAMAWWHDAVIWPGREWVDASLTSSVDWLLTQCGCTQTECRHACMQLVYNLCPSLPGDYITHDVMPHLWIWSDVMKHHTLTANDQLVSPVSNCEMARKGLTKKNVKWSVRNMTNCRIAWGSLRF